MDLGQFKKMRGVFSRGANLDTICYTATVDLFAQIMHKQHFVEVSRKVLAYEAYARAIIYTIYMQLTLIEIVHVDTRTTPGNRHQATGEFWKATPQLAINDTASWVVWKTIP